MATRPNVYRNKKKYTRKEKFKKDLVDWNKIHIFVKQIKKHMGTYIYTFKKNSTKKLFLMGKKLLLDKQHFYADKIG